MSWIASLVGGALIGAAASLLLLGHGRIAGISAIVTGTFTAVDRGFRVWFLLGLAATGLVAALVAPSAVGQSDVNTAGVVLAGLLVGYGTRLGDGCTSGHGVCGVSRGARRSIAATVTFMASGMVTVYVLRHVLGAS
jgi:uncharacterized membrane protein YedE/YeeE